MDAVVVYDSNFGNTKKIAEAIAAGLKGKAIGLGEVSQEQLDKYDLLVVGSPINGWMPTKNIHDFIAGIKDGLLTDVKVATFDTRVRLFIHGDAMQKMAKSLQKKGAKVIIDSMPFYVDGKDDATFLLEGELERAKDWGLSLRNRMK